MTMRRGAAIAVATPVDLGDKDFSFDDRYLK